jgi:AcrR family transcriptional regulator
MRTDAERNRQRILIAALELFGARGLNVPLEDVARHAGIGIATLYRRFPTRADLITATFEHKIAEYTAAVDQALANSDPWRGFCGLVHDLCALQAADAGLKELLTMSFPDSPLVQELTAQAERNLAELVARAQSHGELRADFHATDVLMLLMANGGLLTATRQNAPDAWRRFAAYMIDAFRAGSGSVLPGPPNDEDMRQAMTSVPL